MKRSHRTTPFWRARFRPLYLLIYANRVFGAFVSEPRWGQGAAVVDNLLYVYGGKTDQFGSYSYTSAPTTNDLFTLDLSQSFHPASPSWQYVCGSEDSSTRQGQQLAWHTLSAYNTSQLLLFGGDGGPNSPIVLPSEANSANLLDVGGSDEPTWINEQEGWAGQPSRRIHHTATSIGGKVYIVGGERDDGSDFGYSDHYVFDPSVPSFRQLPSENGPPDIYGHGSVVLSDGRILFFGGYSQSESRLVPFSTIWSLDTRQSNLSWSTENVSEDSVPSGRRAFAYTWLQGDRVLIHGGSDADFQTSYSDGWVLDATTRPMTWSNVSALTQIGARRDHFAVQVGTQVLFGFGYGTSAGASVTLLVFNYDQGTFTSSFSPQSGPSLTTLPAPAGTGGSSSGGSHGSGSAGTGGTGGSKPTHGSGDPSSTDDPSSDGGNGGGDSGGEDKKNTAVIAVASVFGVFAIGLAAGLLVLIVVRRRRSRRQFYLLNNEDEHPRPGLSPPWELAGIAILPWFKARRALARGEKTRVADKREGWIALGLGRPRERIDMLANEDASELGVGRRRLGSGDSRSWISVHDDGVSGHELHGSGTTIGRLFSGSLTSLKNIGSGVRRVISGGSAKGNGHRREWTDVSLDPYDAYEDNEGLLLNDKNISYDADRQSGELGAERDIALAARPRGGKESSNSSKYVDPFLDQIDGEVLFDACPTVAKRDSLDGSEPSSSKTQSQKAVNVQSSQSTLSHVSAAPQLPPLIPTTSKSSSDRPSSSSVLDGSNAGHSTSSSSQHAALSFASSTRPRTTSIINASAPPTSPVKRSDSWWTRFKRSRAGPFRETSLDLGKAPFAKLDLDFRDPNPPPGRLGAIKEVSGGSGGTVASPRASRIAQAEGGHDKSTSGSSAAGRLYLASGHHQSTSSLKTSRTADSVALERLAGRMDVAFREATGTSVDCGSSLAESLEGKTGHERDATWSTLGSRRRDMEGSDGQDLAVGPVLDDGVRHIVQSPTEIAPASDVTSDRIAESIRMVSQPPQLSSPQSTTSLSATLKGLKGKNPISPGTVATRVADYERRLSVELFSPTATATPTLSSPSPVSTRSPKSQSSLPTPMSTTPTPTPTPAAKRRTTNVKYGLVQRPELFIANPDRDRHSISGSSDT